ncbi:hypothetical protein QBC36DRAFT_310988 [Triangularia setosa]|uniref:Uncharacterized protein n=1 Tax=Triangularia setosa TaxID=2587417 RepID=A0AAN6W7B9_9PEZI|nr:hypothetical protein QBC36DRAFT_310988 [Podospora setosa]
MSTRYSPLLQVMLVVHFQWILSISLPDTVHSGQFQFFDKERSWVRLCAAAKHICKVGSLFGDKTMHISAPVSEETRRIHMRRTVYDTLYDVLCYFRTFKATDERDGGCSTEAGRRPRNHTAAATICVICGNQNMVGWVAGVVGQVSQIHDRGDRLNNSESTIVDKPENQHSARVKWAAMVGVTASEVGYRLLHDPQKRESVKRKLHKLRLPDFELH